MTLVLGIDGGGTKTHAVIADADGAVRGFATSGPANWEVVGLRGAGESLREATRRALQAAGAESGDLLRAFAALARTTGSPATSLAASTLEALSSAGRDLNLGSFGPRPGNVRFVEPQT